MADAFDLLEKNVDRLVTKVDTLVTEVSEIKITLAKVITQISFAKWFVGVVGGGTAGISVVATIINLIKTTSPTVGGP